MENNTDFDNEEVGPSLEETVIDTAILANTIAAILIKKGVFTQQEFDTEIDIQVSELESINEVDDDLTMLLQEFDEGPEADEPV